MAFAGKGKLRGGPVSRILSKGLPPLDDHSSAAPVAGAVKLPTRTPGLKCPCGGLRTCGPFHAGSLFGIAPGGACRASPVARPAVGSYPTVSHLPCMQGGLVLCGAFPGVAPAGRYPAPFLHGVRTFLEAIAPRSSSPPRKGRDSPVPALRQGHKLADRAAPDRARPPSGRGDPCHG